MSRVPVSRIATLLLMVSCLATPAAAQSQQSPSTVDLAQRVQTLDDQLRALQTGARRVAHSLRFLRPIEGSEHHSILATF